MAAASGEPSGNPWELTDDALEPGSRLGRSAAVHATEFRPTGAPRIAAAQEQTAADPLPQRAYSPAGTTAGGASLDVRDATQDAGVQCSVTLDFQPRIAPGGLSQLGHNRSPSSVHLSRQAVQGPRFPGGRRQAEVDTVYCEVCGGRAPQASGEVIDLTTVFPSSLAVRLNSGVLRFLGEASMAHRAFTRAPIKPTWHRCRGAAKQLPRLRHDHMVVSLRGRSGSRIRLPTCRFLSKPLDGAAGAPWRARRKPPRPSVEIVG
ncbi:hypothetical protein HPB47_027548 [Ixodes persulcatus]|uniref:Uncharacterized protein n=1 Tax=Ixodes persulcatus TaxID=34615 RepID=A0AC60PX00_IXOPE|nr:hypothetical protein HPB47_027548 [Ixodes persulcatus]